MTWQSFSRNATLEIKQLNKSDNILFSAVIIAYKTMYDTLLMWICMYITYMHVKKLQIVGCIFVNGNWHENVCTKILEQYYFQKN